LLAGLLISCTTTPDPAIAEAEAAAKAKAEENVALVNQFMDAFQSGEVEAWGEICAEDFVTWGPGIESESNLEGYIESMKGFYDAVDSMKSETIGILPHTVEEGEQAGDYVFWWGFNSAYFIKEGKRAKIMIHTVYKIEDGKIKWNADYWDTGDLEKQLSGEKKDKGEEA
jgi:ketosteroid isomerase-like protein